MGSAVHLEDLAGICCDRRSEGCRRSGCSNVSLGLMKGGRVVSRGEVRIRCGRNQRSGRKNMRTPICSARTSNLVTPRSAASEYHHMPLDFNSLTYRGSMQGCSGIYYRGLQSQFNPMLAMTRKTIDQRGRGAERGVQRAHHLP